MKKTLVYSIPVTVRAAKIQFQIPLPRNTKRITGIQITTTGCADPEDNDTTEVGWLWLRNPQMHDVFFSDIVQVPLQRYGLQSYAPISSLAFTPLMAWVEGTRERALTIEIGKDVTLLEGFYVDQLFRAFRDSYLVQIYLKIEV